MVLDSMGCQRTDRGISATAASIGPDGNAEIAILADLVCGRILWIRLRRRDLFDPVWLANPSDSLLRRHTALMAALLASVQRRDDPGVAHRLRLLWIEFGSNRARQRV
jgi:hypothetical protein